VRDEVAHAYFLLTYCSPRRLVGVVIMEAPSVFQAHMNSVVRRFAAGVPFGECHEVTARMMTVVSPTQSGRVMFGTEASLVIRRLIEGRASPEEMSGRRRGVPTSAQRLRRP
jgi:hypothetical protein